MKKIWITGAEGHIGTALLELLEGVEYQLLPTDIHEVDITKIDEVTQFVYVNRPDVIINCAGMTDVAECEKNIDEAYRVNAIGVRNVVENKVDLTKSRNLIIAGVIFVCGLGFSNGLSFTIGGTTVTLTALAIAAIAGILLNMILPGNDYEFGVNESGDENREIHA